MTAAPCVPAAFFCLGFGVWLVRCHTPRRPVAQLPPRRAGKTQRSASLALVLDLIAAALRSGLAAEAAIGAVTRCAELGGDAAITAEIAPLSKVGRLIAWGAEPEAAWRTVEQLPGHAPVATAGRRCAGSGARLADALAAVARRTRAERHQAALLRANRVGVWSLLPLGFCFLPAFVCLGIAPVVGGLGARLLGP